MQVVDLAPAQGFPEYRLFDQSDVVQYLTYLLLLEDNIQTTLSSYLLIFCAFVVIHHFCWFASF